jgi:hypothetical protein
MAAGPRANLRARPSAAKLGPHARIFSCCAMNNPVESERRTTPKKLAMRVTLHNAKYFYSRIIS